MNRRYLLPLLLLAALLIALPCCDSEDADNSPAEYVVDGKGGQTVFDSARMPVFSLTPGVYTEAVTLTLTCSDPSLTIRYTTDCRDPKAHSPAYSEPFLLSYREEGDENGDVTVCNIRAASFDAEGNMVGRVVCASYLFPKYPERFTTKIVSVVSDPENLYGSDGIITNKGLHGREGERPANVQFFSPDGTLSYQQDLGMRLNGAWARNMAQKNFRFFARKDYTPETGYLDYPLFPGLTSEQTGAQIERFDSFIIRGGATNFGNSMITSPIAYEMMEGSAVDAGNFEAVTMFLNGEYYGLMMYLEDYEPYYFESHYGVDADKITTIQYTIVGGNPLTDWEADDCSGAEFLEWQRVRTYIQTNDMTDADCYAEAERMLDIDNFIEYLVFNCYTDNWDWPRNNQRIWRYNALPGGMNSYIGGYDPDAAYGFDGRWRFVIKDLDISHGINAERELNYASNVATDFFQVLYKDHWSNNDLDLMLDSLLENDDFRRKFFLYIAEFLSTVGAFETHLELINTIALQVSKEIVYHHAHYEQSLDYYNLNIELMRDFAKQRPNYVLEDVNNRSNKYDYGYHLIKVTVEEFTGGSFSYNGGSYRGGGLLYTLENEPIPLTVTPDPGYYLSRAEIVGGSWNNGAPCFTEETCTLRLFFSPIEVCMAPEQTSASSLVLNEIGHSSREKVNGSDWLELYNPTEQDISLRGWQLENGTQRHSFPNITVPAGGYKVVFLDGSDKGGVYVPFTASGGDTLKLLDRKGQEIDAVTLLTRSSTAHLGRYPDGGEWVELTCGAITPNAANVHLTQTAHHFSTQVQNTVSVNAITLDPALFALSEDGSLTVKKATLQNAELLPEIRVLFLDMFHTYDLNETIDLHTWYTEQQGKKSWTVYYVESLNSYAVYIRGIDLDDYEMPL